MIQRQMQNTVFLLLQQILLNCCQQLLLILFLLQLQICVFVFSPHQMMSNKITIIYKTTTFPVAVFISAFFAFIIAFAFKTMLMVMATMPTRAVAEKTSSPICRRSIPSRQNTSLSHRTRRMTNSGRKSRQRYMPMRIGYAATARNMRARSRCLITSIAVCRKINIYATKHHR